MDRSRIICFEILSSNLISFGSDVGVVLGQTCIVYQGSSKGDEVVALTALSLSGPALGLQLETRQKHSLSRQGFAALIHQSCLIWVTLT